MIVRLEDKNSEKENLSDEIKNHWGKNDLSVAMENNWIKGYKNKSIKPDKYIIRVEFVAIVNKVKDRKINK